MKRYNRIIPERKYCDCHRIVKNHHWLCDVCWGKKAKLKRDNEMRRQLFLEMKKYHEKKFGKAPDWINKRIEIMCKAPPSKRFIKLDNIPYYAKNTINVGNSPNAVLNNSSG